MTSNLDFPVGTGFELGKSNLRVWRLQESIRVTDLTNAAIRRQLVSEFSLRINGNSLLSEDILRHILTIHSYNEALSYVSQVAGNHSINVDQRMIPAEKVEPMNGFSPLFIMGQHLKIEVLRIGFFIEEIHSDCPRKMIGHRHDLNVFHRWVSRHLELVTALTFSELLSWLETVEIRVSDEKDWNHICPSISIP